MTGADELAVLETNTDLLRIASARDVSVALTELLACDSARSRAALLVEWWVDYPQATSQLLDVISRDPTNAAELSPAVLACEVLPRDAVDDVLIVAYAELRGPFREAAADRTGVRRLHGLDGTERSIHEPDPRWLWPKGEPFPSIETIEGVQARLNFLGLGAGPVDGEWTELTRRAFIRWQVLNGFEPTGVLDFDTTEHLARTVADAPE